MFVCVFAKKFSALASQSCCEVSRPRAVGEYEYRLFFCPCRVCLSVAGSGPVAMRSIWLQRSLVVGIMLRSNRAGLFRFLGKMASERMGILKRVLMEVPISQLATIVSAKYQLTTIFLANAQLTTNFGQLLTFNFLQRILFRHNPNFPSLSKSITFGGGPS